MTFCDKTGAYVGYDYVLGLDIPMQDVQSVQIPQCLADLFHDVGSGVLTQPFLALDDMIELTVRPKLKQKVDIFLIVEETVKLGNVGMVQA